MKIIPRHIKYVLISLFLLASIPSSGYNLKQITNRNGLSNNSVTAFCQDYTGLLWIGTCDGLNMYNGKSVSAYKPKDKNNMLSGNLIDRIVEGKDGIIWIQTYYGLNKYDKKTNSLEHFDMFNNILFLEKDSQNNIYLIQENNSIFYYIKEENRFEKAELAGIIFNEILDFTITDDNRIWIFTVTGKGFCFSLNRFEDGKVEFRREKIYSHDKSLLHCYGEDGSFFFVDSDYSLYEFKTKGHSSVYIEDVEKLIRENGMVSSIIKFHDDYFIGFRTNGLFVLRKNDSSEPDNYTLEKIPINSGIFSLLKDRYQDIVWIGTDGQGIYSYSNDQYSIRSTLINDFSLKMGHPVRALYIDDDRTMWIGSKGDGILKIYNYDINKSIFDCKIENITSQNSLLNDNSVYAFAPGTHNILWIGSEEGLNYYSYSEKRIKKVDLVHNGVALKYIHAIYEQGSYLWLASVGMGAIKARISWNGDTPVLTVENRFIRSDGDISSNYFFSLYPENDRYIWFANRGGGIFKINTETFGVEAIKFPDKIGNKTINEIISIKQDDWGNYLIGTSFGLIKYKSDNDYQLFNTTNGFPNSTIHCILPNSGNDFWISTNRGVINYNSEKETFKSYTSQDGLDVFEFSDGAAFRDKSTGVLFFGGINGFISVKENDYRMKEYMPPIIFDNLTILGENYNIMDFIIQNEKSNTLELDYSQNLFSVSYIAIDHINANNHTYYYKLEGINDRWIDNGSSNTVSFTNFAPGEYELQVKYYNRATDTESKVSSIRIKILPPWYQSSLAYLAYYVLFIVLLALVLRWFVVRSKKKQVRMVRQMEQQHKEEIYESKLRFFTNIAHEFCTPLTLIYGPCSQILNSKNVDKSVFRYTQVIQQNAERLNSLILDLIEFRRVETGYKKPVIEKLAISEVATQTASLFTDIAGSHTIDVETEIGDFITWNSDKNFIVTIMTNLISNAFKYTNDKGKVKIKVAETDGSLLITISNTGKGVKPEDISKIFDRYSILDSFEKQDHSSLWSRNGLGLAISYGMVNLLQGTIQVESSPNEWTHFIVRLPHLETNADTTVSDSAISQINAAKMENNVITALPKSVINEAKPTIMVIDDEIEMLWFINEIFAGEFNVICFSKPSEAISILNEIHPDIILCDVMMPEFDGISFTRQLKANQETAHIPLILISAKHEVDEQIAGMNAGAEIYITKPFNVDFLKTSVNRLISRKEALKNYFSSPISAFELANGKLTHKEHKKFIKTVFDIINKNIKNKDLSVNFIALKLNMSTRNLYRKMNEIDSEISIADMIRDSRLYIAEDLLVKSKLTIDEIIFKSGFANRVSFFKAFAKKYGCTPKEYREQNSL
ncbi:hybrid sensor histidine kinase/response regulator transcription factor [Dysgonomonas sp. 511]|uniref:hybrid sensor histidine kinase/response regulator transcription factor n=1 Tax=Dysgonomonas sp. 511 TaxID=2302930 RepID=UPI0013D51DB1|nr:hybrid sensor histidine kinase/response regulator transcription factor [Dysgonomonas sp. 511]NDV77994.1 hybrid sensor histidine kinase/response regulator [Dysgonomonas sp. 511]